MQFLKTHIVTHVFHRQRPHGLNININIKNYILNSINQMGSQKKNT